MIGAPKFCNGSHDLTTPQSGTVFSSPHIKFAMSTITCNEEMKGNAKCKNPSFKPSFGGLRGNVHGSAMARVLISAN